MRLTRIAAADLRREPALVLDALKATGFFAGRAGGAGRGCRRRRGAGAEGGARRLAGRGTRRSSSPPAGSTPAARCARRFEGAKRRWRSGSTTTRRAATRSRRRWPARGWRGPTARPWARSRRWRRRSTPGDFAQFLAKLALYKLGDAAPLGAADVAACAPPAGEAELDALVALAADGDAGRLARARRSRGARRQPDLADHRRRALFPRAARRGLRPPRARGRRWRGRGRRSSGRGGRGWRRRRGRWGRTGSSGRWG